ncbi:gamma-glutamylcyclotransferase [Roseibacterium sp. SDUM158016]|uniref:gamma-glutamylcyclotransferase n=1 Tax=Roseicyclus sediminis TaxID=2980997 RepID=UPI0021D2ADE7|nr:gamma-glutamylcyclotransferase [Roseibacterium sp. SDUM158016]MCU4653079.1 gamma-glutamylcyclotransferase [Roseibacterium sp. SDUM158016]
MIGPAYIPAFVPIEISGSRTTALTFLANHDHPEIMGDITPAEQIRCIATGEGFLGTSHEYLANIVDHFDHLGIADAACTDLLREVDLFLAGQAAREPDQ